MSFGTVIVAVILLAAVIGAIWYLVREKKAGRCAGCPGCQGCAHGETCPHGDTARS